MRRGFYPCLYAATTEAFATYGTIDDGSIAQPVKAPAGAIKGFGGLDVTTSSTQLQELTDARHLPVTTLRVQRTNLLAHYSLWPR